MQNKASWIVAVKFHGLARRDQHPTAVSHFQIISGVACRNMQIFTSPQAMPQAMPQAEYQKFRIFQNIAPGFALRHCPRANKNLHMASGHASGIFLHNISPQGFMQIFISPQAWPQGKYANLFDLRHSLEKYANFYLPSGYALGNGLRQTISFGIPISLFILVP
ncbi:hypothetical protein T4C_9414 [Trichinella pseudospiralis]|uniref:Uncharacterized protein n=2 Tax=Trichinella pseudospiralis TaxID=6337 RepID=A0A0V1JNF2_TRIPS|nr:hypothetical protein T4C_9414 [Trichinella pseudospiralis]